MGHPFTYPEVGATADDGPLPPGYHHLEHRVRLPAADLAAAVEPLLTWRAHRAAGLKVTVSAPRVAVGVRIRQTLGLGPVGFAFPCQVVWTVAEPDRIGFGYGTLPGHPERGEDVRRQPGSRRRTVVHRPGVQPTGAVVHAPGRPARRVRAAADGPPVRLGDAPADPTAGLNRRRPQRRRASRTPVMACPSTPVTSAVQPSTRTRSPGPEGRCPSIAITSPATVV